MNRWMAYKDKLQAKMYSCDDALILIGQRYLQYANFKCLGNSETLILIYAGITEIMWECGSAIVACPERPHACPQNSHTVSPQLSLF